MKKEPHLVVFVKNKVVLHFPDGTNEIYKVGSIQYEKYWGERPVVHGNPAREEYKPSYYPPY